MSLFFFQAEDGIRAGHVTGVQTLLFRSPRALYSAQIHDHLYFVAGHTSPLGTPRTLTTSPLVLAHEDAGRLLAVAGLDAAAEVMDLVPQLHAPTVDVAHSRNSPSTDTPWGYTVRA